MRHGKKFNHLGRTASHRKAMLSNMASSLILHKRISTTVAKAKALRKYVEPLITKSKSDTTHSRRVVFSYLQNKESSQILFDEIADKVADRPGGYTRIIKTGARFGDNAETCIIELVDYNELLVKEVKEDKKTRRSRRGGKKSKADDAAEQTTTSSTKVVEAAKEKVEAKPETQEEVAEEIREEAETKVEAVSDQEVAETKEESQEGESEEKKKDSGEESN
jgi:large subunit ribosomal protein L17